METLEKPNKGEYQENDGKEFEPFVGQHSGQFVVWTNVNL